MTPIAYDAHVTAPEHILIRELEGEAVLLNLKTETYFGLDDVGMRMWQVLTTSASIREAYEVLLDEYDVPPQQLRQDLDELLGKLVEQGLVEVGNG
jgi:hypothetical protein